MLFGPLEGQSQLFLTLKSRNPSFDQSMIYSLPFFECLTSTSFLSCYETSWFHVLEATCLDRTAAAVAKPTIL